MESPGASHPRSGPASKFTSSKAYCCIPRAPKGHPGIYVGRIGTGDGCLKGPAFERTVRDVIRSSVLPIEEAPPSAQTQTLFDYGNHMEPIIFRWLEQLLGAALRPCGRFNHPTVPFLASTPDFVLEAGGTLIVGEIKAPTFRELHGGTDVEWWAAPPGERFHQDNVLMVRPVYDDAGDEVGTEAVPEHMDWGWIGVSRGARIPPYYVVQCLQHCLCAGAEQALIVQATPGGPYAAPHLFVTPWTFDRELAAALLPYWTEVWRLVLAGRRMVAAGGTLGEDWPWTKGHRVGVAFDWAGPAMRALDERREKEKEAA